jgi:outer membrane biosynthesis protein TonB
VRSRIVRCLGAIALLPLFGLIFWLAAIVASTIPALLVLGVNVHGLGLASYAGDSALQPAPLSLRVIEDARQDAGGRVTASPVPAPPSSVPSCGAQPTPSQSASPTPKPSPTPTPLPFPTPTPIPTLPVPSPTPTPLPLPTPTPTPTPSLLPLPLPPILPSLLPGL